MNKIKSSLFSGLKKSYLSGLESNSFPGLKSRLFSGLLVLFLAAGLILATAGYAGAEEDTLVAGQIGDASGVHAVMETDGASLQRVNVIFEPLVVLDRSFQLEPGLARDWEVSEDGLEIVFYLEEGVKFHNGDPFTAEDVKYTYEWLLDEDNPAANRDLFREISEINVRNDHEIEFILSEPYGFILNNMARLGIIPADYHEEVGYEEFRENPVGTGPYSHVEWQRDDYHLLAAHEDYRKELYFDYLEFRPIPEDSTRLLALEGGEIDLFQGGVVAHELERLEDDPAIQVHRAGGTGFDYIGFNVESEFLHDRNLRMVISHLVNREAIVDSLFHGIGQPGKNSILPDLEYFNDEIDFVSYDLEQADYYLEQLEYEPEEITLNLYTHEDEDNMQLAEIISYELGQLGIEVNQHVEELGTYLDRVFASDDYDMYIGNWGGQFDPDRALYRQFHSEGTMNSSSYSNERVDELLDRGRQLEVFSQESLEIYDEIQEILHQDQPRAYIRYTESIALVRDDIAGFDMHPFMAQAFMNTVQDLERVEE